MAGHSHSANIAVRKGAVDKKRSSLFSKLSRNIMSAVRQGGTDPDGNLKLRYAIEKARAGNMPKDNIERVIQRAGADKGSDAFENVNYEGYAPGGVAVMVACLTDNRHRTAPDVKNIFERCGGHVGSPGSVGFLFQFKTILVADRAGKDENTWLELALESGAEDVEIEGDVVTVTAGPADFLAVKRALEQKGLVMLSAETGWLPMTSVAVTDREDARKLWRLLSELEENDDVQGVYANYDMPAAWIAELSGT